jgi:hypothetical protein
MENKYKTIDNKTPNTLKLPLHKKKKQLLNKGLKNKNIESKPWLQKPTQP